MACTSPYCFLVCEVWCSQMANTEGVDAQTDGSMGICRVSGTPQLELRNSLSSAVNSRILLLLLGVKPPFTDGGVKTCQRAFATE